MSETLSTKRCGHCKQFLAVSEFYKDPKRADGLRSWCKVCCNISVKAYRQTERGKEVCRRASDSYRQTEPGKRKIAEYLQTQAAKEAAHRRSRKYLQSEKGKEGNRQRAKDYDLRHPARRQAGNAIQNAVQAGAFAKATTHKCSDCGKTAQDYHHWSYDPEYWFDVIPLCKSCHKKLHRPTMVSYTRV